MKKKFWNDGECAWPDTGEVPEDIEENKNNPEYIKWCKEMSSFSL